MIQQTTIALDQLCLDEVYQREALPKHRAIARDFDAEVFAALLVGQRTSGKYYIVDGGQRYRALLLRKERGKESFDDDRIPCSVFQSKGRKYEAAKFLVANTRTGVSALDTYAACLAARESSVVSIEATIREHGFRIGPSRSWPTIRCVSAVRQIVKQGGSETLGNVLWILSESWSHDAEALHDSILKGIGFVLIDAKRGKVAIDLDRLQSKLEHMTIARLKAEGERLGTPGSGHRARGITRFIKQEYNKRLKVKEKLIRMGDE